MINPVELEKQSSVKISRWVDVYSEECKMIDDGLHDFTLKCMKSGFESGVMFTDALGRIWAKWTADGAYFPFHTEYQNQLIGYRLVSKALS